MQLNFLSDPQALDAVQGKHDIPLVFISWLVALAASYAGLDIIKLVRKVSNSLWRALWLLAGASAMGLGVWSMHFIGMHAYQLDFPVTHAPVATLLSIVPAILGSLSAMVVLSRNSPSHHALLLAGVGLGAGIGAMHYSGMAAMRMPAELYHSQSLFLISLLVAVVLGVASVYVYRLCQQEWGLQRSKRCAFIAALCVSIAVSGMHYVAMQAAWFSPDASGLMPLVSSRSRWLIYLIGIAAVLTALITLVATGVQRRLHASQRHENMTQTRLLEVISALQDSVVLLDNRARIRLCNAAFKRLVGSDNEHLLGKSISHLAYAEDNQTLNRHIRQALDERGEWSGMISALRANGKAFPAWLSVSRVNYADSDERDYVALLSDRSEEQQAQQRIRYLAYHDMLTELPNRRALQERLADVSNAEKSVHKCAFLALLDIDRFKLLNDSLGQDIGDELLRQLSGRLQHWVEAGLYAARLDGNEFALVGEFSSIENSSAQDEVFSLIDRIRASLTAAYELQGHTYPCKLNVGVLIFNPSKREGSAPLFKRADLALLVAKRLRDGQPQFFREEQERELEERLLMERELRIAIDHDELCLYLQPQVNDKRQVIGAEALVRWQHPKRGMVSPGHFITLAEETGLILPLGEWVLKEGCRLLGEWQKDAQLKHLKLSLNVSVRQFQQPDFTDQVLSVIKQYDAPPDRLTLELTESLLLSDPEGTIKKMQQLQHLGVSFALDDFGTGYSSLSYLKLLPLDTLKIDIAFVRDLTLDMQARPIAGTIIALAESLGLGVIAEGVETEDQRLVLANLGCGIYQGFLFGRPMPVNAFTGSLSRQLTRSLD
ncbi:EAL domain-containing protein [Halomonas sp. QHL1]|uniref:EAL domain-containing protein n=1 Tax=Halomonas sp. QHL1 TaxID=1123773 RepID=UPI0008FD07A4|nr:EAL domain-containing protein [Halomonas sp. QHL1]OJA05837.1 PAS domain S-box protein [Halomonas sp. QHL1]